MNADQPASIPVAAALVLSTGVALAAVFIPSLDETAQIAIIAFGNAVIGLGTAVWLNQRTTSNTSPVLPANTTVAVEGTSDTVVVQPTPPGPTGTEGGAGGA